MRCGKPDKARTTTENIYQKYYQATVSSGFGHGITSAMWTQEQTRARPAARAGLAGVSTASFLCWQTEKPAGIVAAGTPEFFGIFSPRFGHGPHGKHRIGRFVAFAAPRQRCKIGGVGFQQHTVGGDKGHGLAQGLIGLVRDRAGNGYVPAVAQDAPRNFRPLTKTVHKSGYPAKPSASSVMSVSSSASRQ